MIVRYLFLIFIYGCAFFIPKDDLGIFEQTNTAQVTKDNYCKNKTELELIDNNQSTHDAYIQFINITTRFVKLNSVDKYILWSFFQLNTRPDISSPSAKFSALIDFQKNTNYIEVSSQNAEYNMPTLAALNYISEKFKSIHKIEKLAQIFDQYGPSHFKISQEMAQFLIRRKNDILSQKFSASIYSRGGEILQAKETIPKIDLKGLISSNRSQLDINKYKLNTQLIDFNANNNSVYNCNYDFKLYDASVYLINENIIKTNTYGYKDAGLKIFTANNQIIEELKFVKNTLLFEGRSQVQSSAICYLKNADFKLWLFSDLSRDPGQHLYHLLKFNLQDLKKIDELNQFLSFSRHLILRNPLRLIFESKKSSKEQLDMLLKLNMPTYNAESLGNIWSFLELDKNNSHFYYDPRNSGNISCL